MNRLLRGARRFAALTGEERTIFALSLLLLPVIGFGLHRIGFPRLHGWLEQRTAIPDAVPTPEAVERARRLGRMVNAAARVSPFRAYCLNRSLTLWWLLRRRGIASDLRVGVRKGEKGFEAHAWVSIDRTVINDSPRFVGTFAPLSGDLMTAYRFVD